MTANFSDDERLILFARAPELGRVKTRLARAVGDEQALQIYVAMLRDTIEFANEFAANRATLQTAVAFTPPDGFARDDEANLNRFWRGEHLPQSEGDLGRRMHAASTWAFQRGAARVALIGTDSPDLPSEILHDAFEQLKSSNAEIVFSPASDGGFVLLGMNRPCPPQLFAAIDWTQSQTLQPMLSNAEKLGWRAHLLPSWFDVDEIDDWHALQERLQTSSNARHCREMFDL